MSINERIRFFRKRNGLTQKYLGLLLGFSGHTAETRVNQYETATRTPKNDITQKLADSLGVSPRAIDIPPIETALGAMHTLFALEDLYGLKPDVIDGLPVLRVDVHQGNYAILLSRLLDSWEKQATAYRLGKISKEEYDHWRYYYPEGEKSPLFVKTTPTDE